MIQNYLPYSNPILVSWYIQMHQTYFQNQKKKFKLLLYAATVAYLVLLVNMVNNVQI